MSDIYTLLGQYWDAAYDAGLSSRTHDTEDAEAQKILSAVVEKFDRLHDRLELAEKVVEAAKKFYHGKDTADYAALLEAVENFEANE